MGKVGASAVLDRINISGVGSVCRSCRKVLGGQKWESLEEAAVGVIEILDQDEVKIRRIGVLVGSAQKNGIAMRARKSGCAAVSVMVTMPLGLIVGFAHGTTWCRVNGGNGDVSKRSEARM